MNPWLFGSLVMLGIWLLIYAAIPRVREEMLRMGLFTAPFGLTESLFVPEYWSPPSLFNLAGRTGFDIESIIFCFAAGGIGAVLYEAVFKAEHKKLGKKEALHERELFHRFTLLSPAVVFVLLYLLTKLNPIYSATIAMFLGGILARLCRPDLKKKIWAGGILFAALYFAFFRALIAIFPAFISAWNLAALSGIFFFGVPLEEMMFAFTFGMLWSSIYEHVMGYRLRE